MQQELGAFEITMEKNTLLSLTYGGKRYVVPPPPHFQNTHLSHTHRIRATLFNFLTVFDIKITKSPRIPNLKRKVGISSIFNTRLSRTPVSNLA
jgi:hypothetical protein